MSVQVSEIRRWLSLQWFYGRASVPCIAPDPWPIQREKIAWSKGNLADSCITLIFLPIGLIYMIHFVCLALTTSVGQWRKKPHLFLFQYWLSSCGATVICLPQFFHLYKTELVAGKPISANLATKAYCVSFPKLQAQFGERLFVYIKFSWRFLCSFLFSRATPNYFLLLKRSAMLCRGCTCARVL